FSGTTTSARPGGAQQDPRDVRVDAICDQILAELRTSPDAVKDIFIKPDETIAALRATCRNLTRRERDLRRFLSPQDDERLTREREALQKRVAGESDEVTRMRLASALAALDAQRDQRVELARAAARFDAEHTRISYTLESLYTQVVRMRSADSSSADVAGAGLRRSLDMLSHEATALADALARVNSGEAERMRIGAETRSQDDSVAHVDSSGFSTVVGDRVTVGHSVVLHGCRIGDDALIGMGSIVLRGAEIGDGAMIGAGSLVTAGTRIPAG